ncbi:MAG: relaxase/mobilization nuclease domain-containing protein [Eubacterium sp.]
MPIVRFSNNSYQCANGLKQILDYCTDDKKVVDNSERKYVSGVNCTAVDPYSEFMLTKKAYPSDNRNGQKDRYFYHYYQSFSPNDNVTRDLVHQIGIEFAKRAWRNNEVIVATHLDKDHLHNHFVINGIDLETGKRLRQGPNTLKELRAISDEICLKYGVNILPPYEKTKLKSPSSNEYRAALNGNSWKFKLAGDIDYVMTLASDKQDFISLMNKLGYDVLWSDDRKYITYSIIGTKQRCRDKTLHEEKYLKENMENEFKLRQSQEQEFISSTGSDSRSNRYGSGQSAMAGFASGIGCQRTDDRLSQQDVREYCEQENSQGPINTGWESERQDYFNGQVGQKQNEGIYAEGIRDNVSNSSHQQPAISGLDIPSVGIIDEESDDPELRERQRRAKQNADAIAYGMEELAKLIEESKNSSADYEDEKQDWGPVMGGM